MDIASLRQPIHLILCLLVAKSTASYASLPVQCLVALAAYVPILLLVFLPLRLFIYQPFLSPLRHIPRPPSGFNTWRTWLLREPTPPRLLEWTEAAIGSGRADFHGVLCYRGIGGSERLLVTSPGALKELLVTNHYSHVEKPKSLLERVAVVAGNGLIAASGDSHKAQKRKLQPAFSPKAIKELYPLYWSKARELLAALKEQVQHPDAVNIVHWTSRSALDIIGIAAWGADFSAISQPGSKFLQTYSGTFDLRGGGQFINALALVVPMRLATYLPLPYNKRLKEGTLATRKRCASVVQERLSQSTKPPGQDLLSLLIRSGVTDATALTETMMTMLAAGHHTSSVTLAWGCLLLSKNPGAQTRLRDEVRGAELPWMHDGSQNSSADVLNGLPYLRAVSQEILRLMPAVPVTRREAHSPATLQGYYIPRGTQIVSSGWVVNRLQQQWGPDAASFRPERWLDGSSTPESAFAFASFSHGPRACIGQAFATGELLVFLAALVGQFEMKPAQEQDPTALFGISLSPAGGINIRLEAI